jgi:hypothetical protein
VYIKGAMADPVDKTINAPKRSNIMMMGRSQNFFLVFINPNKSAKKSMPQNSI